MRFVSIRSKMLTTFTLIITGIILGISVITLTVFWKYSQRISQEYLLDVTTQSTNNLNLILNEIENMNLQIISSPVVQEQLKLANENPLNDYQQRMIWEKMNSDLERSVLFGMESISLSIYSKKGYEYALTRTTGKKTPCILSTEDIYKENGSTLWRLSDEHNLSCAKAILSLATMEPIGYIYTLYPYEIFGTIVEKQPAEYVSNAYIVSHDGTIISSSQKEMIGEHFPIDLKDQNLQTQMQQVHLGGESAFLYVGNEMRNGWRFVESISVKEFYKSSRRIILMIILITLFMICLGVVIISSITAKLVSPTKELLFVMEKFGHGNLTQRVNVKTNDEIGRIGTEYNQMADNVEKLIRQVYEMEILQKQSEIDFLRMQINPHFLYNTLDTISWMSFENRNDDISEVVYALADLLRAMIRQNRFVTVEEEMVTVHDYLLIQQYRFEDKISVSYDVDDSVKHYEIPNCILQPIIENAIIHGLEPKVEKGHIQISIRDHGDKILFSVEDDGIGMDQEEIRKLYEQCHDTMAANQIGLKNVYRRLILSYGEESHIEITSQKNKGTLIQFSIPKSKEDGDRNDV